MTARAHSRRSFLSLVSAVSGAVALGCRFDQVLDKPLLPDPATSGLDHIIMLMMENRSFDHVLGWLPGADGKQEGLAYLDAAGVRHPTWRLQPDFQGCAYGDPDHSYAGGRVEYNGGACDGWLLPARNDLYAIGYYSPDQMAFFGGAAPYWTTFDRYFCSVLGPTFPNRLHQLAAQTDRLSNTVNLCTLPTILDRLAAAGHTARYYVSDASFLRLWGDKYDAISRPISAFYSDCASGSLPDVAIVEPAFNGEGRGTAQDDHPYADVRAGQAFMNGVYDAVRTRPLWPRSALVINYDEWGGFFDHVPPPEAALPDADRVAGATDGLRGFRVPAMLISPFARRRTISHRVHDHESILRMIEWRFGLAPLTVRDASATNLAEELDFAHPDLYAPKFDVPEISGSECPATTASSGSSKREV